MFVYSNLFKRSIGKQVILTNINHPRPLIPDWVYLILNEVRDDKPDLSLYGER